MQRFYNVDRALAERALHGGFLVLSLGISKFYSLLPSVSSVASIDPQLCLSEVIVDNSGRMVFDFDEDVGERLGDIEAFVVSYVSSAYGGDIGCRVSWLHSSDNNGSERRWHCIVAGLAFVSCWKEHCILALSEMTRALGELGADRGVYRHNATLRLPMQLKLVNGSYTRPLRPLIPSRVNDIVVRPTSTDRQCRAEVIRATPKLCHLPMPSELSGWQCPRGFVVDRRSVTSNGSSVVVRLLRVSPSFCELCQREHTSDNAYVVIKEGMVSLRCFRASKG